MFKKGIGVIVPLFVITLSTDVSFFETTTFSLSSIVTNHGEDDDLLVYTVSLPIPTLAPVPIKPPITQVYSQRQNPPVSSLTPVVSSLDPIQNDDLLIALHKCKRRCAHLIPSFVSYNHFSSSSCSFIASLDSISLPNSVYESLSHPGWHNVMVDEMQALDDNITMVHGTWCLYVLVKRLLVVAGCL